jgi:hypothetical protein
VLQRRRSLLQGNSFTGFLLIILAYLSINNQHYIVTFIRNL